MNANQNWKLVEIENGRRVFEVDSENLKNRIQELENSRHKINFHRPPEPMLGNVYSAPVLLLNGNPSSIDADRQNWMKLEKRFTETWDNGSPFCYLEDDFECTGGATYWRPRLTPLIEACELEAVKENVAVVECFPYPSIRNPRDFFLRNLPSVHQLQALTREAKKRGALVIRMRAKWAWKDAAIDGVCSNWQKPYLSKTQLGKAVFDKLVAIIREDG